MRSNESNLRVSEVNLSNDVDKRKNFTQEEVDGVSSVTLGGLPEVFLDEGDPGHPVLLVDEHQGVGEVPHEHLHQSSLHVLPHDPRQVEGGGLEEQHEHDPLVVAVVNLKWEIMNLILKESLLKAFKTRIKYILVTDVPYLTEPHLLTTSSPGSGGAMPG